MSNSIDALMNLSSYGMNPDLASDVALAAEMQNNAAYVYVTKTNGRLDDPTAYGLLPAPRYQPILEDKIAVLRKAEAQWFKIPTRIQDVMSSQFFRLHFSWSYDREQNALKELKRLAINDTLVRDNYHRRDIWQHIFFTPTDGVLLRKALAAGDTLARAQDAMPPGYFISLDKVFYEMDNGKGAGDWIDVSEDLVPILLLKDSKPLPGYFTEVDRPKTTYGLRADMLEVKRVWLEKQDELKKMKVDIIESKKIHNDWMAAEWKKTLGYQQPMSHGKEHLNEKKATSYKVQTKSKADNNKNDDNGDWEIL